MWYNIFICNCKKITHNNQRIADPDKKCTHTRYNCNHDDEKVACVGEKINRLKMKIYFFPIIFVDIKYVCKYCY